MKKTPAVPSNEEMDVIWRKIIKKWFAVQSRAKMTGREKVWLDVWFFWLMAENGGYWHYFHVSAGHNIHWLLKSLRKVGATGTYQEVSHLCKAFPRHWPSASYLRRLEQLKAISESEFEKSVAAASLPPNCCQLAPRRNRVCRLLTEVRRHGGRRYRLFKLTLRPIFSFQRDFQIQKAMRT